MPSRNARIAWFLTWFALIAVGCGRRTLAGVLAMPLGPAEAPAEPGLILSFEKDADLKLVSGAGTAKPVERHATDGKASLKVELEKPESTLILSFPEGKRNVTGADRILADVTNDGDPLHLAVRVVDQAGKKYVVWYQLFRRGRSRMELNIPGFASAIDPTRLDRLEIYSEDPNLRFHLDNLRLVKASDSEDDWLKPTEALRPDGTQPDNLLGNGGFEFGLAHWQSWGQWDGGDYLFDTVGGDEAWSGATSAAIICRKQGRGGLFTDPLLLPAGNYLLSWRMKGTGGEPMVRHAFDGDGKDGVIDGSYSDPMSAGPDWKLVTIPVRINPAANGVRLYFFATGTGTLLLDEVQLFRAGGKAPPKPKSRFKQEPPSISFDGPNFRLNGKPWFPIGLYNAQPAGIKGTRFNWVPGARPDPEWLDDLHALGVVASPTMQDVVRGHLPHQAAPSVAPILRHPAVIGWYTCDEPDHAKWTVPPAELRLTRKLLGKVDPKPTFTVVMPWADSNLYQYADTVDVLMTDIYPLQEDGQRRPMIEVTQKTRVLRQVVGPNRPAVVVTQADRFCRPGETRLMTWLALAGGANGVAWWEYNTAESVPAVWKELKATADEVDAVSPILLGSTPADQASCADDRLAVFLKESEGRRYLIAVNWTRDRMTNRKIKVPGVPDGSASEMFSKRTATVAGGVLTDAFEPFSRSLFELPK